MLQHVTCNRNEVTKLLHKDELPASSSKRLSDICIAAGKPFCLALKDIVAKPISAQDWSFYRTLHVANDVAWVSRAWLRCCSTEKSCIFLLISCGFSSEPRAIPIKSNHFSYGSYRQLIIWLFTKLIVSLKHFYRFWITFDWSMIYWGLRDCAQHLQDNPLPENNLFRHLVWFYFGFEWSRTLVLSIWTRAKFTCSFPRWRNKI